MPRFPTLRRNRSGGNDASLAKRFDRRARHFNTKHLALELRLENQTNYCKGNGGKGQLLQARLLWDFILVSYYFFFSERSCGVSKKSSKSTSRTPCRIDEGSSLLVRGQPVQNVHPL